MERERGLKVSPMVNDRAGVSIMHSPEESTTAATRSDRQASRPRRDAAPSNQPGPAGALAARLLATIWGLAFLALGCAAPARADVTSLADDAARDAIRFLVEREVGDRHRVEVRIGRLDPRLQLASCARVEPFVPPAARLWGRTSIGVRCIEGARWSILVPVTVSVYGKALVAAAALPAGSSPVASDFRIEEVDLTKEYGQVVSDAAEVAGQVLTRSLAAGQTLRQDALRTPPSVNAGDPVKIFLVGQGFTIVGEGVALSAAAEGDRLRVRTESGKVLVAPVRGRGIEIKL
jgi:flagella basal body P-ring formation protein FlgA